MTRLKFFIFALVALGLWGYHLVLVAPAVVGHAVDQASASALGVPAAVALRIEGRRSDLQAAVVRLAGSAAVLLPAPKVPAPPKPEAPSADRFNAVKAAALEALGSSHSAEAVVGVANDQGALVSRGGAEGGAAPEGFNVAAITTAGTAGSLVTAYGVPHLFYAVPLLGTDKNEVKWSGWAFVGLPVLPDAKAVVEAIAKEFKVVSVGLVSGSALIASAGDKDLLDKASKLIPGSVAPVAQGTVDSLGPLALPMFVSAKTLEVGSHRALAGTPYSVVSVVSVRSSMQDLASYQKFGFGGLLGLLLLSIVVALILGGAPEEESLSMVAPPPVPMPPKKEKKEDLAAGQAAPAATRPSPEAHQAPEMSPDDFHIPTSSRINATAFLQAEPPAPVHPPEADPFAAMGAPIAPAPAVVRPPVPVPAPSRPPPPPPGTAEVPAFRPAPAVVPAPSAPSTPFEEPYDDDDGATKAYPSMKGAFVPGAAAPDPFAMAAAQMGADEQQQDEYDDNPEATRVATVPQELIKQARTASHSGNTGERPALKQGPAFPSLPRAAMAVAPVNEEERHFQDVFRDFVATREKCGEPADGLTFDKFKAKLLKNKDQLVTKYNCRSVRFQVYVKEGKAALKASPVKD